MDRKLLILAISIAMLLVLGCAESSTKAASSKPKAPSYTGFMDLKAGMWAETVTKSGNDKVTTRTELIEYSPSLAKYQFITDAAGMESVAQLWIDPSEGKVVKYIMESDGEVLCMDTSKFPSADVPSEGDDYPPKPSLSLGTYMTPAGDTVSVAKFSTASGEAWVSSEVPFGMVKVIADGKTVASLYDFGTIGARSRVSDDDIASCTDMTGMADVVYQAEPDYEEYEEEYEEDTAYEEYRETSDTYDTKVYDNTGKSASMDCSACYQMPAAAKNACLAACG